MLLFLPVNAGYRADIDGRLNFIRGSPCLIIGFRLAVVVETKNLRFSEENYGRVKWLFFPLEMHINSSTNQLLINV